MARIWPWYSLRGQHIRITWFSLYGIYITWFSYMVMMKTFKCKRHCSGCDVAMGCYGRSIVPGALLWRHNNMAVFVPLNMRGPERGTYQSSSIFHLLDFDNIRCIFLLNNPIYIISLNCKVGLVFVVVNKCSGLRPWVTLSSRWHGWCHARRGKQSFVKSFDLLFQTPLLLF